MTIIQIILLDYRSDLLIAFYIAFRANNGVLLRSLLQGGPGKRFVVVAQNDRLEKVKNAITTLPAHSGDGGLPEGMRNEVVLCWYLPQAYRRVATPKRANSSPAMLAPAHLVRRAV